MSKEDAITKIWTQISPIWYHAR